MSDRCDTGSDARWPSRSTRPPRNSLERTSARMARVPPRPQTGSVSASSTPISRRSHPRRTRSFESADASPGWFTSSWCRAVTRNWLFVFSAIISLSGIATELPVQSVIVLLRRKADGPDLTGKLEDHLPSGALYHDFRYNVVRVWERPADEILAGNIATLPLAPIARVSSTELPAVIKRMEERFETEADPHEIADLWAATYVLMGLVYPESIRESSPSRSSEDERISDLPGNLARRKSRRKSRRENRRRSEEARSSCA